MAGLVRMCITSSVPSKCAAGRPPPSCALCSPPLLPRLRPRTACAAAAARGYGGEAPPPSPTAAISPIAAAASPVDVTLPEFPSRTANSDATRDDGCDDGLRGARGMPRALWGDAEHAAAAAASARCAPFCTGCATPALACRSPAVEACQRRMSEVTDEARMWRLSGGGWAGYSFIGGRAGRGAGFTRPCLTRSVPPHALHVWYPLFPSPFPPQRRR